jgi:hypothetical protein
MFLLQSMFGFFVPPLVFGLVPLFGALLCILLPETANAELPDTLDEGENFGKYVCDPFVIHCDNVKTSGRYCTRKYKTSRNKKNNRQKYSCKTNFEGRSFRCNSVSLFSTASALGNVSHGHIRK